MLDPLGSEIDLLVIKLKNFVYFAVKAVLFEEIFELIGLALVLPNCYEGNQLFVLKFGELIVELELKQNDFSSFVMKGEL